MQTTPSDAGMQVADYGRLIRRQLWVVLASMLVCGLIAIAFTTQQAKTYQATASVLVQPIAVTTADAAKRPSDLVNMDTESQLVHSASVGTLVKTQLKSSTSVDDLVKNVSVTVPANTEVLQLSYQSSSAKAAQDGANAFAKAYLDFRRDQASAQAKQQVAQLNKQQLYITGQLLDVSGKIAGVASNSPDKAYLTSQQQALTSQLTDTRGSISRLTNIVFDPGEVVQAADLPTAPISPSLPLNTAVGLAVGALIGVLLALLRNRRDDRIRTAEDLEGELEVPVLATVPAGRQPGRRLATLGTPGPDLEAYRRLRSALVGTIAEETGHTAVQSTDLVPVRDGDRTHSPGRIVLVTDVGSDTETAEVGANLAVLLARGGSNVVFVDARNAAPSVDLFGLTNDRGLSDVVEREAYGEELIQRPVGIPNLAVIASGRGPIPVGEMMSTRVGRNLLDWLQRTSDYVVISVAPITSSADAQSMAPVAQAILLAVPAGIARQQHVRTACHDLAQVGGRVAGAVLLVRKNRRGRGGAPRHGSEVSPAREEETTLSTPANA
jgi:succinoglycan biosynthesis transport protein ExoP